MPDSVTIVTRRSWGSRLSGSLKGIVVGALLVLAALWVLFSNEGRAVGRYKALQEGASNVVSVTADRLDPANEGKVVHLTGRAATTQTLRDPDFGVTLPAIHLRRQVEMYQWLEDSSSDTEKKVGGGTETTTTYSYRKGWSGRHVDSSSFKEASGHGNPPSMPYGDRTFSAERVTLGAFRLSPGLIERMTDWDRLRVTSADGVPSSLRGRTRLHDDGYYVGASPASPQIGDLRVSFGVVQPGEVSVVAVQTGDSFQPYPARTGAVQLLHEGTASAEEMFAAARSANKTLTWILRFVGFLVMTIGIRLVVRPLSVLADVLPVLGNLVGRGTNALSLMIALPLSLAVIAFSWIAHRPLLATVVFVLAAGGLLLLVQRVGKARKEVKAGPAPARSVAPPAPPPPPPEATALPPLPKS